MKQTGRYTLSPESFPYIEITPGATFFNRHQDNGNVFTPQSIRVELPNGKFVDLEQLVDHYMNQWRVNEPASPIDEVPAFLRHQAD